MLAKYNVSLCQGHLMEYWRRIPTVNAASDAGQGETGESSRQINRGRGHPSGPPCFTRLCCIVGLTASDKPGSRIAAQWSPPGPLLVIGRV